MKTILYTIILIAWACTFAWAGTVTLAWDHEGGATSYEVFRGIEKLATVTEKRAVVGVNAGDVLHVIAVGPLGFRSEKSETLTVLPEHFSPLPPTKLRIVIEGTVTIYSTPTP